MGNPAMGIILGAVAGSALLYRVNPGPGTGTLTALFPDLSAR